MKTHRQSIPQIGMIEARQADLRAQGVVVISYLESVQRDPERLKPHYHEFFQLIFLHGPAKVMHDFQEVAVDGVTLVFLSPGQVHRVLPGTGMTGTTVSFSQAFFDHGAPPPSLLYDLPYFFPVSVKPWLQLPGEEAGRFIELFNALQTEFDQAKSGAAEVLRSMLHILVVWANRIYAQAYPAQEATRAAQMTRAFHLAVEQDFRERSSVSAYAQQLGVSANHLNDTVQQQTGRSAGDVIRQRRVLDAKRLLCHSDLSVAEIGYQLGFRDPSYFSRFFRRHAGLSPEAFRVQIREKYQSSPV